MKHTLSIALAAFACGIAAAAPASAAPNPCTLVKQNEAARALGTPVLAAKPSRGPVYTECRYLNSAQNQNVVVQVYDSTSQFPGEMLASPQVKKLPQVAPKAFALGTTLFMVKHGTYVTVSIYKSATQTSDPALIPLAKLASSRM